MEVFLGCLQSMKCVAVGGEKGTSFDSKKVRPNDHLEKGRIRAEAHN